jgi:hypothetical protein
LKPAAPEVRSALGPEHLAGVTVASYLLWFLGTLFADLYVRAMLVAGRFLQRGWLSTRV